jgi:hypothetical protein
MMLPLAFADVPGPFEFLLKWLPTIGWPAVIIVVWYLRGFISKAEKRATDAEAAVIQAGKDYVAMARAIQDLSKSAKEAAEKAELLKQSIEKHIQVGLDIAANQVKIAALLNRQEEIDTTQFNILKDIAEKSAVVAAQQTLIVNGFQRMVERLIDAIKDDGKG